jgi:hypothetical protein
MKSTDAKESVHDFIETAFTSEQVDAAISAEERAGIRDGKCAFLDGPVTSLCMAEK